MPENARKCPTVFCQIGVFCLNIARIGHGLNREGAKAGEGKEQ
jgi:hypothetical protein